MGWGLKLCISNELPSDADAACSVGQTEDLGGGLVTQWCLTLCSPMDCSPSGFSVHGILLARILEWAANSISLESSLPRD